MSCLSKTLLTVIPELLPMVLLSPHQSHLHLCIMMGMVEFDLKHRPAELQVDAPGGSTTPTINATLFRLLDGFSSKL